MVSCFSNEQPLINTSEYFNSGDFFRLGLLERKRIKQEALKFEASLGQTVRPWFKKKNTSVGWEARELVDYMCVKIAIVERKGREMES